MRNKEGGVMDIQKEREAFEQALVSQKNVSINNLHVCTIFDAEKNKYSPSDVCDPKEDFIVDWINSSWSIWQAAKANAVPEGFVLVPKEPTLLMQRAGSAKAIKPNLGIASMRDIYKAMIEAQEPAND